MNSLAQTGKAPRRIGILASGTQAGQGPFFDVFRAELKNLGYIEGRDVSIEARWTDARFERLASLAAELVSLDPTVIVTATSAAVAALKKATASIPVVFASAIDPVEQGFVASLRRPGGNITRIILHSGIHAKIVEITREAFSTARRLAMLVHDADPVHKLQLKYFEPSAQRFKFEPVIVRVARAEEFERAFTELVERKSDVLYVPTAAMLISSRKELAERALKARLPLVSNIFDMAERGGLLSYATLLEENYRRAAALVDKILRGAKPGELPVEQPERFELVVNLKTAKAIGVTLSPVTMLRANRVIE